MPILTRDNILGINDRESVPLEVPEWGGTVLIASMTAAERDHFEASFSAEKDRSKMLKNFRARFISKCLVDEKGENIFSPADIEALGKKSASVIVRVFDECQRVCGYTSDDMEEIEGNLERE